MAYQPRLRRRVSIRHFFALVLVTGWGLLRLRGAVGAHFLKPDQKPQTMAADARINARDHITVPIQSILVQGTKKTGFWTAST